MRHTLERTHIHTRQIRRRTGIPIGFDEADMLCKLFMCRRIEIVHRCPDRIVGHDVVQYRLVERGRGHIDPRQNRVAQIGRGHVRARQVRAFKIRARKIRLFEIGPHQLAVLHQRTGKICPDGEHA